MKIDSVDYQTGNVSLLDMDMQGWFPVFRSEPVPFVRQFVEDVQNRELESEVEADIIPTAPVVVDKPREPETEIVETVPEAIEIDGGSIVVPPVPVTSEIVGQYDTGAFDVVVEKIRFGPERHNFHITDDSLGVGGEKTKYKNNVAAIQTLKRIEAESRLASPDEQEILSRYVGWGGIAQAFDPKNEKWSKEYAELKKLLTPKEYESARSTVLNAHYTSPQVIKAIYRAVGQMDFKPGNILDIITMSLIQ